MVDSTTEKRTEIGTIGEFGLIKHITRNNITRHAHTLKSVGDDSAVLDNGDGTVSLITTDLLVEGIHFDLMYTPLKHLGFKAVAANVSDICAMNGVAQQITVSLALSNRFSVESVEALYEGIYAACKAYNIDLVGGDTTASPRGLVISVTAIGRARKQDVVYRNGAKVGDLICISGELGGAYLGLQLLEREKKVYLEHPNTQPDLEKQDYVIARQLKPEARIDMIEQFRQAGLMPTSMIDISDGLASELFHICEQSNVGAFLEEDGVPINIEAQMLAIKFGLDPITCALSGGEDYELLFTIDPSDAEKVRFMPDIYLAGEIVDKSDGIKLHTKGGNIHPITAVGWQHFGQ